MAHDGHASTNNGATNSQGDRPMRKITVSAGGIPAIPFSISGEYYSAGRFGTETIEGYRSEVMYTAAGATSIYSLLLTNGRLLLNGKWVCGLPLGSGTATPDLFISVVNSIPKGSIVLVEDFEESPWVKCRAELSDSTLPAAKDTSVHGGRSALLNWLDGVSSLDGKIIILSTNTVEVVDKALLRPGRLDHLVELPDLTTDVIMTHCLDLWPELSEYQVEYSQLPGCVLHRIKTIALDNVELVAKLLNEYAKNPELAMLEQSGNVTVRNPF